MKRLFFLFLGLLPFFPLASQSLIEDALELKPYFVKFPNGVVLPTLPPDKEEIVAKILLRYSSNADLELGFKNNPYISFEKVPNSSDRVSVSNGSASQAPSSFVTYFADGLAKFIADRTKQELTNAFFRHFKADLDRLPVLDTLFPATGLLLRRIDKDIYFFDKYIDDLRIHFIKDLERLPIGLRELVLADRAGLGKSEKLWVADLLQVSQLFVDGFGVKESLEYLASAETHMSIGMQNFQRSTGEFKNVSNLSSAFKVTKLLVEAVQARPKEEGMEEDTSKTIWVEPSKVYRGLNDPATRDIILGLLYQQGANIDFVNEAAQKVPFQDVLKSFQTEVPKLEQFKNAVNSLVSDLKQTQVSIKEVKSLGANPDKNKIATYYRLFDGAFGAFQAGLKIKNLVAGIPTGEENKMMFVIRQLSELNMHLRSKAYGSAVINVGNVIDTLSWNLLRRKNPNAEKNKQTSFSSYFWRYGSFMASVAEAKNSDEVAYALDRIALPPGSAAMKKSSSFSLMINAYGGISSGVEFLGQGINQDREAKALLAPWAPLGLDISFGNKKRNSSKGLYFPVVDVGALAAFRLGDTKAADVPQLKWNNIIAPGAYLVFGFTKSIPLSFSVGGQLGPNLRKVNTQGITLDDQRGYRIGATLAIDIPVLRLVGGQPRRPMVKGTQ